MGLSRGQRFLQSSAADSDLFLEGLRVLENCTLLLSTDNLAARAYFLSLRRFGKRQPGVQGLACTTSLGVFEFLAPLHTRHRTGCIEAIVFVVAVFVHYTNPDSCNLCSCSLTASAAVHASLFSRYNRFLRLDRVAGKRGEGVGGEGADTGRASLHRKGAGKVSRSVAASKLLAADTDNTHP